MLHKRRSFGARKVSPPQPTCMTDEQKASYLADLRSNRPARPTGSRPLPTEPSSTKLGLVQDAPIRSGSALSFRQNEQERQDEKNVKRFSIPHAASLGNLRGRPLVMAPNGVPTGRKVTPPEISYKESAARQREKQEAHSLRQALEEIDFQDDDTRIYDAAQREAADLVWKHRNPQLMELEKTAPYRNPDLPVVKKRYVIENTGSALDRQKQREADRKISGASNSSQADRVEPLRIKKKSSRDGSISKGSSDAMHSSRRRTSNNRQTSSGSSKGVFRNPEDQIYEEPEIVETVTNEVKQDSPLRMRTKNPLLRGARPLPEKSQSTPLPDRSKMNRVDIYKNPPTQSRDAAYMVNNQLSRKETPEPDETPKGRTMEIRSDEIRAATSMKRSDRSPKLPTPTAVSDKPGRPIVSFDPKWRAPTLASPRGSLEAERPPPRSTPTVPALTVSAPAVPTINVPEDEDMPVAEPASDDLPRINLPDDRPPIPGINLPDNGPVRSPPTVMTPDEPGQRSQPRPLPSINAPSSSHATSKQRPLPSHTQSSPSRLPPTGPSSSSNRLPWLSRSPTPSVAGGSRGATVACTACSFPIAGRIVTASGSSSNDQKARLHPECFTCYHCGTGLECVSFYPEPESARLERLNLDDSAQSSGMATGLDLRFYCHLDFHDLFSPRCASCKTPIEGAVVLAAGKAWHEGHFFCAECGDPFSSSSPFVESKGYAYCVGCHTRRTSARCRSCKNQILDEISIEALGGKWHEECFNCDDCGGGFGEDGRFFVREVEIELTEKEKRKGMDYRKVEERAVCEGCEGRRLKSRDVAAFL